MNKQENKNNGNVHIIRRNVKVINTFKEGEVVDEITTNASGDIKKSHVVENKSLNKNNYKKDNRREENRRNNDISSRNKHNNSKKRNVNVIVTRNGKPVEETKKEEAKKEEQIKEEVVNKKETIIKDKNVVKEATKDYNKFEQNKNVNDNRFKEDRNFKNFNNKTNDKKSFNRDRKNYNNDNDRKTFNKDRKNYDSNDIDKKPFNKDRRNYNNDGNNRPFNNKRNFSNNEKRPFNGERKPYNNFNKPKMNQVDKFIKNSSDTPLEQKETKNYSLTLIDKKKYNNQNNNNNLENKKNQINKNELREKQSRVSTSKLRNLEVDSSGSMLDLYERDSDSFRKTKKKKEKKITMNQTKIIPLTEVKIPEVLTVKEFAEIIKKQASEVIKKLFSLGIMATVNQEIDFDTAFLIAEEFGIKAEKQLIVTDEDILFDDSEDDEKDLVERPPIVVVMGHVDHGKTSLLDRIRSAHVVNGEAGGITQHIGAYKVNVHGKEICFMDTPGHEAFTEMRARGANITDIAVIVVAADDGIKPQTIEAIDHAKAADVSIIVAINKIDKDDANVDRVKQDLLEHGLVAEEWGGDTICVPISAKTGEGVDNLLEMILLTAEVKELKANPHKQAKGVVIEARLDKNIGTIASVIVQRGELNISDTIVVGNIIGKVRAMRNDKGTRIKKAGPSTPVEIIGLPEVPETGDVFYEVENEKVAKHLVETRKADSRRKLIKEGSKVTLDDLFGQIKEGEIKDLNIILKADVQGTLEALKNSLEKLSNDEVRVRVIHSATGGVKESDVTLASVSNAIIIGFNVRPELAASKEAEKEKVDLRLYRVIYDAINDVETAMKGMLKPTYKEVLHGTAEVRATFKISNVGTICGCYVKSGNVMRNTMVRLVRDNVIVADVKLESLKREKDDVKEVKEGYECGIKLENYNDVHEGDMIECYEMVEEKR